MNSCYWSLDCDDLKHHFSSRDKIDLWCKKGSCYLFLPYSGFPWTVFREILTWTKNVTVISGYACMNPLPDFLCKWVLKWKKLFEIIFIWNTRYQLYWNILKSILNTLWSSWIKLGSTLAQKSSLALDFFCFFWWWGLEFMYPIFRRSVWLDFKRM